LLKKLLRKDVDRLENTDGGTITVSGG